MEQKNKEESGMLTQKELDILKSLVEEEMFCTEVMDESLSQIRDEYMCTLMSIYTKVGNLAKETAWEFSGI